MRKKNGLLYMYVNICECFMGFDKENCECKILVIFLYISFDKRFWVLKRTVSLRQSYICIG